MRRAYLEKYSCHTDNPSRIQNLLTRNGRGYRAGQNMRMNYQKEETELPIIITAQMIKMPLSWFMQKIGKLGHCLKQLERRLVGGCILYIL